jgi:tRNA threonylcarbamoyl adenosine modification protein YeaZ
MILYIDTAFEKTILAIKKDGKIYEEKINENTNISQILVQKTDNLLKNIGAKKTDIKLIGFNKGPGNFTSLRVALAYVKAIGFYLNIPVVALNSFQILALSKLNTDNNFPLIIAIDARMNEIYWAKYDDDKIFSDNQSYELSASNDFYKKLTKLKYKKINLIKNNSKILNDYNKINIIVNASVCDIQDINLDKIFNSIENLYTNNFTDSIDKVNLLYIRDNVAHKKNE